MLARTSKSLVVLVLLALAVPSFAQWRPVGPEGGDVRSLTYDPRNPDRILLGTSAGELFQSLDNGKTWARFAHLGQGDHYVLDNVAFDPTNSDVIYVAAWSVDEQNNGDLFRSRDGGKTWQALPGTRGRSIRALALAETDSKILTIGALEGVFRSFDSGDSWQQISPPGHPDIRNIESIAIDRRNPEIIYAGTWHLPWKTMDGGKSWQNIKQGVIDDSDVFSIIIDHSNPATVYASACSGIYKSENAGSLFHKIQGIPGTARRTRVLQQDPANPQAVYAGTTEGLWKTVDGGKTFKRITAPNYIVNDVLIDPRNASHVLVATDRSGVLSSNDGGQTFIASNKGFSHRQVSTIVVDRKDASTIYAGVLNDKEFGGVFKSTDAGTSWTQLSDGLAGRDVFHLSQGADGTIVASTNRGIFVLDASSRWQPANLVLTAKPVPQPKPRKNAKGKVITAKPLPPVWIKSELDSRVAQISTSPQRWVAATSSGLYVSRDNGKSWSGGAILAERHFVAAQAIDDVISAATPQKVVISTDGGTTWRFAKVPDYITVIYGLTMAPDGALWLSSREGAIRSGDRGETWMHVIEGLPARNVLNVSVQSNGSMLASVAGSNRLFESRDNGQSWTSVAEAWLPVRSATVVNGNLLAATAYDGLLLHEVSASAPRVNGAEGSRAGGGASR